MSMSVFRRVGAIFIALTLGLPLTGVAHAAPPSNFPPFDFEFQRFTVNGQREAVIHVTMSCAQAGRVAVGVYVAQILVRKPVLGSDGTTIDCWQGTTTPLKFVVAAEGTDKFRAGPLDVTYEFDGCAEPDGDGFGFCHQEIGFDRKIAPWGR